MNRLVIGVFAMIFAPGCTQQDAEAMGRIGIKAQRRVANFLFSEKNQKVTKTIPLLQPQPAQADAK